MESSWRGQMDAFARSLQEAAAEKERAAQQASSAAAQVCACVCACVSVCACVQWVHQPGISRARHALYGAVGQERWRGVSGNDLWPSGVAQNTTRPGIKRSGCCVLWGARRDALPHVSRWPGCCWPTSCPPFHLAWTATPPPPCIPCCPLCYPSPMFQPCNPPTPCPHPAGPAAAVGAGLAAVGAVGGAVGGGGAAARGRELQAGGGAAERGRGEGGREGGREGAGASALCLYCCIGLGCLERLTGC